MDELIARVFQARNIAHREHLRTKSYAKHMALGDFYANIIPLVDQLAETYIGAMEELKDFMVDDRKVSDVSDYLRDEADWMESVSETLGGNATVANLILNLSAVYYQTAYKLDRLA